MLPLGRTLFQISTLLHITVVIGSANLQNITVDDTASAFILAPENDAWNGPPSCNGCSTPPESGSTYSAATWNNSLSTVPQNLTFTFTGSALYLYGIISQSDKAFYSFSLDGQSAGTFSRDLSLTPGPMLYNQTLYSNPSIPNGQHTFVIQNGQPGVDFSLLLFDYLIYTQNDRNGATVSSLGTVESIFAPAAPIPTSRSSQSATNTNATPASTTTGRTMAFSALTPSESSELYTPSSTDMSGSTPSATSLENLHPNPSHGISTHFRTLIISLTTIVSCVILAFLAFSYRRHRRHGRAAAEVDLGPFDDHRFARWACKQRVESQQGSNVTGNIMSSRSVARQLDRTSGSSSLFTHSMEETCSSHIGEGHYSSLVTSQFDTGRSERDDDMDGIRAKNDGYDTLSKHEHISTPSFAAALPTSSVTSLYSLSPSSRRSVASGGSSLDAASRSYPDNIPPSYTSATSESDCCICPHMRSPSAVASVSTSSLAPPSYTSDGRPSLNRMRSFWSVGVGSAWSHEGVAVPNTPLPGYDIEDHIGP